MLEEPAEVPAAPEKWILEMDAPEGGTKTVDLGDKVTIGRNPKNTIGIQDSKASNFHCEIVRDGPGYAIRDLNSTNGTRVDGKLVETLSLYHGSVIEVGKTRFLIKNLAVPDMGPGFESGPVGGAEFSTFSSRKRFRLPVVPILLLLAVAGGLYALNELASRSVRKTEFQSPEGNLLRENYSFEGITDVQGFPVGFRSLQGDDDRVEAAGPARTGKKALRIRKGAGSDPAAAVEVAYDEEISVSASKVYELSAWALASGLQGVAGVKLVWHNPKDPAFRRESFGNLVFGDGDGFTQVKVRAAPPLGAATVEAAVFAKGKEGTVTFDDL